MRDKIENKKIQRIILILFVLLAICASFLLIAEQTRAPEGAWKNEVYAIRPSVSTFPNVKLDNIQGNTNLSNPVRQEAKDTQTETPKSERAEAGKVPRDGTKEDTDEQGKDTDGPEFEQKFEDLPEDALVQTSLQISDLMKEIGLSDSKQILYVRNITGVGSDTILQSVNGSYALLLSTKGTTIIQVKYKDADGDTKLHIKKINYVRPEGSTPVEKQPLIQTNLKDNGIYNQATLNFDVWITDYRGKALAYSDMEVMVNGVSADYIGEMSRQTYSTELQAGKNTITIKVTDEYQYTVQKTYTVFYKTGKSRITISLEAGTIGIPYLVKPKEIDVEAGVSLSHVLDEYLKSEGFTYSHTGNLDDGFYLASIHKKNMIKGYKIPSDLIEKIKKDELLFDENGFESVDDLGEFDFCQGSGWMYSINDLYSSYGFNRAYVQDGDVVRIRFTLAYGKDIGGYAAMEGAYGVLQSYGKEW